MAAAPNPLLNPSQALSGKPLQTAAQALTDAQTKGPLAELARQIAVNNRQGTAAQKLTGSQFNTLGQYATGASNQETGIANDLNSQLQGIGNATQGRLSELGQVAANSVKAYTPQGENPGMSSPALQSLAAEQARQSGNAALDSGNFRGFGATQGANYRGLAASNAGTYATKGQEALKAVAQANALANEPINQKVANLKASEGSLLATNEGKLRQQEVTNSQNASRLVTAAESLNLKGAALKQALAIANQSNATKVAGINAANTRAANAQATARQTALWAHQDRQTSNTLRGIGLTTAGIATVMKTVAAARKAGNKKAADQALAAARAGQGVQSIVGAVNHSPGSISIKHIL